MPKLSRFDDSKSLVVGFVQRFTWEPARTDEMSRIELGGSITIDDSAALWKRIGESLAELKGVRSVAIDLSRIQLIDGACMALLVHFRNNVRSRRIACEFVGATPEVERIVDLYGGHNKSKRRRAVRRPLNAVEQIGNATVAVLLEVRQILDFFGQLVISAIQAVKHPKTVNFHDVGPTMERAGADAAPIVMLINFLIGFVMAYQSAVQLKQFGANIYVVDLVAVSMTRELGPLMTAIIMCGRSGAAFAAELGTMQVSEEVDALRTLGFMPLRHLVMPRMLGLILVAPFLVLLADAVGILGGLVVAALTLDITPTGFLIQLESAVKPSDIVSGLVKSVAFAGAIALISCQQGLATTGGAEGVGRRTTGAVVSILFALIVIDAIFTILLAGLGL
ncbi:MAG: MlaE family lipid ABC transporter permease subunit [Polyangiaceae bacterium]|nr:MlaE family lipid ABC transporter permease subunit [Polyangiaceae bacterium]